MKLSKSVRAPSETVTATSIEPKKSGFGVTVKDCPLTIAVALSPAVALKNNASPSTSSANRFIDSWLSSLIDWSSTDTNTGASFTGETIIVTTPATDVQSPSETVNEKLSVPLKSCSGE